jgi:hypothetical protein
MVGDGMTAPTLTPEEQSIARALIVREQLDSITDYPMVRPISADGARLVGPHLVELCRLMIQQWRTAYNTPQQLSHTLIRIKELLTDQWALEDAQCHSATASVETSQPSGSTIEPPSRNGSPCESQTSSIPCDGA